MNSKKSAFIVSGVIMLVLIGMICVFSINSVKKGGPLIMTAAQGELRNTIEIPLAQADKLSVSYKSDNLKIYSTDGDKVIIKEYLSSKRENALATVNISDGKASVTGGEREIFTFWLWFSVNERIEIYLPEGLNDIEIGTLSGNITAENEVVITADKAVITAASGNVKVEKISAKEMTLETKSGNISAEEVSGLANISANSGNVTVRELAGCGAVKTKSGNIKVEAKEVTGDLSLQAGSGNVKLLLPAGISFDLEAKTGSGNIHTDYDSAISYEEKNHAIGTVGDAPVGKLSLKAGSGNVSVKQN